MLIPLELVIRFSLRSNLTSSTNDTPNRAKRNSKTVGRMEGSKIKGDPVAPDLFVQETRMTFFSTPSETRFLFF